MHRPVISLDLLRAVSAIIVFLGHVRGGAFVEFAALPSGQQGLLTKVFFGITRVGHEAVLVFFVLSGFLVGGQIVRQVQERRFAISNYALDRITRIMLPLVPACILTVIVNSVVFGIHTDLLQAALNMIGLNGVLVPTLPGNAPLWSLAYEIWFYIIAGGAGLILSSSKPPAMAYLAVASGIAVFGILEPRYLMIWCFGAISVLLVKTNRKVLLAALGMPLFLLGIAAYQAGAASKSFTNVSYIPQTLAEILICVGISISLPWLCNQRLNALLAPIGFVAAYFSSLSYTLYLVHYPLNEALSPIFPKASSLSATALAGFIGKITIIFAASNLLYWAFEARTTRLRNLIRSIPAIRQV